MVSCQKELLKVAICSIIAFFLYSSLHAFRILSLTKRYIFRVQHDESSLVISTKFRMPDLVLLPFRFYPAWENHARHITAFHLDTIPVIRGTLAKDTKLPPVVLRVDEVSVLHAVTSLRKTQR